MLLSFPDKVREDNVAGGAKMRQGKEPNECQK